MAIALAIILLGAAALSGCVCVCADVEAEFEAACRERGGQVQRSGSSSACIAGSGATVATWVHDEDGGS